MATNYEQQQEQQNQDDVLLYVGIGASAGGLEALERFFNHVPLDTGIAYIVIQHLSPDYKSFMVELLSKKTGLEVLRAEDNQTVKPNSVYLIPPSKNLRIFHGKLLLSEQDHQHGLNLPIDIFLKSLAEDQGEKAAAVILSGTGSDGMRGVRAIKENGGIILVQAEDSARFDGMPKAAISTGLADFVLWPEEMPAQILGFLEHINSPILRQDNQKLSRDEGITKLFSLLREQFKVDFTYYKPSTVLRRIERRMTINQSNTLSEYVNLISESPGEINALYRELLIGVTNFFRDSEVFDYLMENCLIPLIESSEKQEIRFWVAGCSTGEEAYTLALLANEAMEICSRKRDIKIFATDIDKNALMVAGNGLYPESIAADIEPKFLNKYFYRRNDQFQISRSLRESVVFARHNLIKDPPFTNIDLVSCRNLLIYLQPVLQKKVLQLFNFSLKNRGYLLLGSSESTGEMSDYFDPLMQKLKIYRSRGRSFQLKDNYDLSERVGSYERFPKVERPSFSQRIQEEKILENFIKSLSPRFLPICLIVNEKMEILHIFGDTEGYFKLPPGKITRDVTKMAVRDLGIPVSTGLQKFFRNGEEVHFARIRLKIKNEEKLVNLTILPIHTRDHENPLAALVLEEISSREVKKSENNEDYDISSQAEQRIHDLEQELQYTKENLQATIEELETANEELQATNEELLASNEELQSTNEELQSTNEELHTVNAEYQKKIVELTELNNDIENLLFSSRIGQLILDEDLIIRRFSPEIGKVFKILETDIGRPITHLAHFLNIRDFLDKLQYVQENGKMIEEEVETRDNQWYMMRIFPYHISPDHFSGIVITFVNTSNLVRSEETIQEQQQMLKQVSRLAEIGFWYYQIDNEQLFWSDEVFMIHDLKPGQTPALEKAFQYYQNEDREKIKTAFSEAREKGKSFDLVLEINTSKQEKEVRVIAQAEKKEGKISRIFGAFQNVSRIKHLNRELEQSRQDYKKLLQILPLAIIILERDEESFILDEVNDTADQMIRKLNHLDADDILDAEIKDENFIGQLQEKMAAEASPEKALQVSTMEIFINGSLNQLKECCICQVQKDKLFVLFQDIEEKVGA